ncbi:olfactory receptor 2AP1-like [Hyperolius riggenbachi]|uniref:olfactory receptor 2AP1-like n=1 Tax=Hyperolius riggenbachi TaxID=752182 RepID=UPI0035A38172
MNEDKMRNKTMVTYFLLKGVSDVPEVHFLISLLVFLIYLTTLAGNTTILLLVLLDSHLHTPMYFFLCNLSILNIFTPTVALHRILVIFVTGNNVVSFTDCTAQVYFFGWFCGSELTLLTAMSYDRCVAICNPLHYSSVMNSKVCVGLVTFSWLFNLLESLPLIITLLQFSCYSSNIINHFLCDIIILKNMTCNDTSMLDLEIFTLGAFTVFSPFLLTFISYVLIIATILGIKSRTGRSKAFYTCSSHLTVVSLLYTSLVCQYLTPIGTFRSGKLLSLFNAALIPMLNPFIYSLKNKDVKTALQRQMKYFKTMC